ncbi:MAG: 50S ribosomal protein L21e [Sulfolobales archaeon]|nr:50S ribosomal protein L21e [Sulfolobales archaeon]MCX8186285.1 50S ribosomal protein L21e [Sulfolobales archaeon]MDW7968979.1 50S ribosomal protein L21e [Sulfolobales archaeon]
MVKASQGLRHKTRTLLKKDVRERGGVPPLSILMIDYKVGDKVSVVPNPAIHSGMPHRRFFGKIGTIVGRCGRAYTVELFLGGKKKLLYVMPEHLRPHKQS